MCPPLYSSTQPCPAVREINIKSEPEVGRGLNCKPALRPPFCSRSAASRDFNGRTSKAQHNTKSREASSTQQQTSVVVKALLFLEQKITLSSTQNNHHKHTDNTVTKTATTADSAIILHRWNNDVKESIFMNRSLLIVQSNRFASPTESNFCSIYAVCNNVNATWAFFFSRVLFRVWLCAFTKCLYH